MDSLHRKVEILIGIISELLKCGYSDTEYILDLIIKSWLDFNSQELNDNYWSINASIIIYDYIFKIAENFIAEKEAEIKSILNIWDLEEYRNYNDLYEIYVNYIDSHLWFKDQRIQDLFDQSEFYI